MPRATFNVLVLPFRVTALAHEYAVFHRADGDMWQFIAGGGEDDETPTLAARREALEEAGIDDASSWIALDSVASIPRTSFPSAPWPDHVYVIPEYCFGIDVRDRNLSLSGEHDRFEWLDYAKAQARLTWDSNKVALWELQERLLGAA